MAENKIKHSDIFADDLFIKTTADADKFLHSIQAIKAGIHDLLGETKLFIQGAKFDNSKDLDAFIKKTRESAEAVKALNAAEKAEEAVKAKKKLLTDEGIKANEIEKAQRKERIQAIKTEVDIERTNEGSINRLVAANKKLRTERDNINKSTVEGAARIKELNQQINANTNSISSNTDELIQNKMNVGNYKGALKDLKRELATLDPGSKKFQETAAKAGELKDRIDDANTAVNALSTDSKGEAIKNLFGTTLEKLQNLDFEGAADQARMLASVASTITFKDAITGLKNFGSAMVSLGRVVLANPLILIAAAVTGLVVGIYELNKAIGDDTEVMKINNDAKKESLEITKELLKENRRLKNEAKVANKEITESDKKRLEIQEASEKLLTESNLREINDLKKQSDIIKAQTKLRASLVPISDGSGGFSAQAALAQQAERDKIEADGVRRLEQFSKARKKITEDEQKIILQNQSIATGLTYTSDLAAASDLAFAIFVKNEERRISLIKDTTKKLLAEENLRFIIELRAAKNAKEDLELVERVHQSNIAKIKQSAFDAAAKIEESARLKKEKGYLDDFNIQKEITDRQTKETEDRLQHEADLEKSFNAQKKAQREKDRIDAINSVQKIGAIVNDIIDAESKRTTQALNDDISKRDINIKRQQDLADKGRVNTLAFEEKQRAEDELKKEEQKDKDIKRAKALMYFNAVIEFSKTDPASAPFKALAQVAIASAIAGAFKDGVEGFKGKGTDTSDSNLVLLSNNESVITAKGTRENTGLATAMNTGKVKEYFVENYAPRIALEAPMSGVNWGVKQSNNDAQMKMLGDKLDMLNNTLKSKKETSIEWNQHGEMTVNEVENGVKRVMKYQKRKAKI